MEQPRGATPQKCAKNSKNFLHISEEGPPPPDFVQNLYKSGGREGGHSCHISKRGKTQEIRGQKRGWQEESDTLYNYWSKLSGADFFGTVAVLQYGLCGPGNLKRQHPSCQRQTGDFTEN